ncbi:hypothetical protein WG908_06635 [Sphingobium sp. AN641]|uniref:hypothetical protein n=1 Tax=Sphingobium sp. AN641 TaxID=3133443 RepID=UPI0030C0B14D
MQQFLMDYGLWLLAALLIIIAVVFLLSRKGDAPHEAAPPAPQAAVPPAIAPVEAGPVALAPQAAPVELAAAPPPATVPISPSVTMPADAEADDILRLKGVGPKLRTLLIELGVTRYAQIAAWSEADLAMIDAKLGNFKGRPVRDQWIDQAKYLAAGDTAGFEAKYGKI